MIQHQSNVVSPVENSRCFLGVYDRKRAIHDMAKNEDVDVITGDWMSECNMTLRGSDKRDRLAAKAMSSGSTEVAKGYEPYFLEEIDPAIPWLARRGVKIAVNAGASDVHGLAEAVQALIKKHGVDLKIGVVDGDDVTDAALDLYRKGGQLAIISYYTLANKMDDHVRRTIPEPPRKQAYPGMGV